MSDIDQPEEPQSSRPLTVYERLDKIRRGEATIKTKVSPLKFNKKPKYVGGLRNNGEFCTLDEGDYNSRIARSVAFRVAPSVVALTSFVGEKFRFSCSGFFIEWNDMYGTILTSASLFIGYKDTMPTITNVTVEVHLPNRETVPGSISHVDLHHNIAILTVPSVPKLHVALFCLILSCFLLGRVW
ncbi:uncharacterized protein LOC110698100 [Chenopodium quinoa]|uniref:uncharacterized protein LOC110698100 n=1 Tax=Chenopodium quinoa TaxID=63459 RepID=UPI000B7869C3|nr:uncharacterized protein LOC110698100 [Chenopodium quinoa]